MRCPQLFPRPSTSECRRALGIEPIKKKREEKDLEGQLLVDILGAVLVFTAAVGLMASASMIVVCTMGMIDEFKRGRR